MRSFLYRIVSSRLGISQYLDGPTPCFFWQTAVYSGSTLLTVCINVRGFSTDQGKRKLLVGLVRNSSRPQVQPADTRHLRSFLPLLEAKGLQYPLSFFLYPLGYNSHSMFGTTMQSTLTSKGLSITWAPSKRPIYCRILLTLLAASICPSAIARASSFGFTILEASW